MKTETDSTLMASPEYRRFIEDLKARVVSARISAARAMNRGGILLYWDIGRAIVERQHVLGWGESVIEQVSADLRAAFPDSRGFSPRNLRDMKRFYLAYTDEAVWRQTVAKLPAGMNKSGDSIWPQVVAEIPWGHHRFILDKLSAPAARLWYLQATARFGWTRNVLLNQIKAAAYERAVTDKKTHNFDVALPEHLAEQADEMLGRDHRHHPLRREGRRGGGIRLARQTQSYRRGGVSPAIETAREPQRQTAYGETARRCGPRRIAGKEWGMRKNFYRYQPPTPAKELLAEFWKLEKEAEKMLEGLADA